MHRQGPVKKGVLKKVPGANSMLHGLWFLEKLKDFGRSGDFMET